MTNPSDESIINQIASYERSIVGIRNSFNFGQNPDTLNPGQLPAVIHYVPAFSTSERAFHNVWKTELTVKSLLMVTPRQGQGGILRYLENAALPFGYLWRDKFQNDTVINAMLSATGAVKLFLASGKYGAGGELMYGATEYLGFVFEFTYLNA